MKDLAECLNEYDAIIDTYNGIKWNEIGSLNGCLKHLSIVLSHLEKERNDAHNRWIAVSMQFAGVAAGERAANSQVPELYQLRRIMTAGYKILDSMRSNISSANKER